MNNYIRKLDAIAEVHIHKHPAHIVDNKALANDREKMIPYIRGPKVLELGCGDGDWTPRMIELFGHSYVLDASSKLLAHVEAANPGRVTLFNSLFEEFTPPGGMKFQREQRHASSLAERMTAAKTRTAINRTCADGCSQFQHFSFSAFQLFPSSSFLCDGFSPRLPANCFHG